MPGRLQKSPIARLSLWVGLALAAGLAAAAWQLAVRPAAPVNKVDFLAVGQGDATLIQSSGGQRVLIDAGPDQTVATALYRALPWFARELDLVVLTHPHQDHRGGLAAVLKHYRVKRLVYGAASTTEPALAADLAAVREQGGAVSALSGYGRLRLLPDCVLEIANFSPDAADANDQSLITRLDCGRHRWLFLGDASADAQSAVLAGRPEWRAEVVKLSHHGSDDGFDPELFERVGARAAVIEVGAGNRFNHPSRRVLKKLDRLGLSVYRTDREGTIRTLSDGRELSIGPLAPGLLKW